MNLEEAIEGFEGKTVEYNQSVYDQFSTQKNFSKKLIQLLKSQEHQKGASRLLKHHLESTQTTVSESDADKLYLTMNTKMEWVTVLNILQSIEYLPISNQSKDVAEQFFRDSLSMKNKFVQAWAYNGLYELARQHPEYQGEVSTYLEEAMETGSASIRARIGKIMKKGF